MGFDLPDKKRSKPFRNSVSRRVSLSLTPMHADDGPAIETLLWQTFGSNRLSLPSYGLRKGAPVNRLSWVARSIQGQVVGCLRFWSVAIDTAPIRSVLLGPLAVDLAYRGAGVAGALVQFGLNRAADQDVQLCFVVGEPRFYRRFGFTNAAWSGIGCDMPIPSRRLQVLELQRAALHFMPPKSPHSPKMVAKLTADPRL